MQSWEGKQCFPKQPHLCSQSAATTKAVKPPSRTWLEEALGLPSFNKAHTPPPAGHSAQAQHQQARAEWATGQKASTASGRFGDYHMG